MREKNTYLPIITTKASHLATKILDSSSTKEKRIEAALQPLYESGTIYHITGECDEMEDQLLRHPINKNDDIIDALAYQRAIVETGAGISVSSYTPDINYRQNNFM